MAVGAFAWTSPASTKLVVSFTAGCDLLCFLDAFSEYHQIKMAKEDEEKMAFITPCGVSCYVRMPFGLKSAGATFQRLMCKALGSKWEKCGSLCQ
jgi:hypothetical protein